MNPQTYWIDVADWFRRKGFEVGDVVTERGFKICFPLLQKPFYRKIRWGGRKYLGYIYFEDGIYGARADKYTNWVFVVYKQDNIDLVNKLAYELWASFGINIQVVPWWTRSTLTEYRALTDEEWTDQHIFC